jgi:hypothetical protein
VRSNVGSRLGPIDTISVMAILHTPTNTRLYRGATQENSTLANPGLETTVLHHESRRAAQERIKHIYITLVDTY